MRECKKCGIRKPLAHFRESKLGYRRRVCSECMDAIAAKWQQENLDRLKQWRKKYYAKNRKKQIKYAKRWNKKNPARKKAATSKHYRALKEAAIMAYGGPQCACCKESEPMFLSVDHINNDATSYKKKLGQPHVGLFLFRWLKQNNYPTGFQILCFNCNQGKHLHGGVCPHLIKKA